MARRTPAAQALRDAVTATPLPGVTVWRVDGAERLVFTTADLASMFFGPPADATEAARARDLIGEWYRAGKIRGRRLGNRTYFTGEAVAEFLRWLDDDGTRRPKAA